VVSQLDAQSVALGDFSGDGNLDILITNYESNIVSVLPGNGDGTFQPDVSFEVGKDGAMGLAVGDFNRDGKPDIAATSGKAIGILTNTTP
jgi:hypothetical protein